MADPSDFVSFSDYLGLNDEAGQGMLKKTLGAYDGPTPEEIQRMSEENYAASGQLGQDGGVYERTKEGVRTGLASYGDFLSAMSDPTGNGRQALMEKAYGKGAASWLDSALTGGNVQAQQQGLKSLRASTGEMGQRAAAHREEAESGAAERERAMGAYQARRQAAADANRERSARSAERSSDFRADAYAREKGYFTQDAFGIRQAYNPDYKYWNSNTAGDYQTSRQSARAEMEAEEKRTGKRYTATAYGESK